MSDKMPVVREAAVLDNAYGRGYDRFADADAPNDDRLADPVGQFKQTAQFANVVAPRLRAAAGMDDPMDVGTYQSDRDVVVIPAANGGDDPAEGIVMSARDVYRFAQDAWDRGARDALNGRDRGATDDVTIV